MAGGMDFGGARQRGGRQRRPLDAQMNLVPFIDLMAVTISFLLLTAAWTQTGRLQVASSGGSAGQSLTAPPPTWRLTLTRAGLRLQGAAAPLEVRWSSTAEADSGFATLGSTLKALVDGEPLRPVVEVRVDDEVAYEDVVRAVDACAGAGIAEVTVHAG